MLKQSNCLGGTSVKSCDPAPYPFVSGLNPGRKEFKQLLFSVSYFLINKLTSSLAQLVSADILYSPPAIINDNSAQSAAPPPLLRVTSGFLAHSYLYSLGRQGGHSFVPRPSTSSCL